MTVTYQKRQKEQARAQAKKDKAARREERNRLKAERPQAAEGVDPDIAGIVPGPQAPLFE
jgi:hypothetical protein